MRFPVYVPSKSRFEHCWTADFLLKEHIPFFLVVEPQEHAEYKARYKDADILTVPEGVAGHGAIPVRNWIWEHSRSLGAARHWQLDDNIKGVYRMWRGRRIPCDAQPAFEVTEAFTERYENIAISGLNYVFCVGIHPRHEQPFYLNCHVYSFLLLSNAIPYRWRGRYNADTDLCLQVLSGGWCTVLINAFLADKQATMTLSGGNTALYEQQDGRLKMARSLERLWPGVVQTTRRFKRPQHIVLDAWRRFDTKLKLKQSVKLEELEEIGDFELRLSKKREIKSERLAELFKQYAERAD